MNAEIYAALAQLEKERGIPQSYMMEKITQALVAAYKKDKDGYTDNVFVELTEKDIEYINEVLKAYDANHEQIDEAISSNSRNWRLSRIPRADLSILRLAICEMMYLSDVPVKAAINEAINLSKLYCEEGGPSFINGVLDGCMKSI